MGTCRPNQKNYKRPKKGIRQPTKKIIKCCRKREIASPQKNQKKTL